MNSPTGSQEVMNIFKEEPVQWGHMAKDAEAPLPTRISQASGKFFLFLAVIAATSVPTHHSSERWFGLSTPGVKTHGGSSLPGAHPETYLPASVESTLPPMDLSTLQALTASLESSRRFEGIVRSAARKYGVDPYLVLGMMNAESNFNTHAVSRRGARGLMQLMPTTARLHKVRNVYDPAENIFGGVRHLRLLLDRFGGNLLLAIAAYNAGATAVKKYDDVPPYSETRTYVERVLVYSKFYRESELALLDSQAVQ